ncbi:MAG: LPXTG cell wall anchor domain-containing protein, partial [Oscillospiraceae bacterium]|nr:LPXTG cell wall anchor domain-containing protein [Oscillospiraceae bacterium]
ETAEEQYLKSAATCTEKAVYYKSCAVCGTSSEGTADEATFTSGKPLGHDWGAWMPDGEGTHKRICTHDASHVETAGCTYGDWSTNQDSHWKTCTVCGGEAERLNHADPDCDHFCDTCGIKMTEHDFTGELAITALLYKEANCLSPALYYKSCKICMLSSEGTASEATFASGEKNPDRHAEEPGDWQLDGDSHWRFYTCCHLEVDRGAHQGGTADCLAPALCEVCQHPYGELGPHHFVDQVNEYRLKSAATCTSPAVYYQSCSTCGAQGAETFTNGEPLGHDYGAWTSNGDGTHTRICAHDAAHTETNNCHGGTATCTHKAVCTVCGGEYGEMAAHSFTAEKAEAQYLKSAATCTEKAVYYKSCAACGLNSEGTADEATFFSGNALDHDWGAWTQNSDEKTHTRICKRDTSHTETEDCHGGMATCTHKAVCTVCGGEYGELDPKNHTNLKHFPAKAATKTTEGNIEYWYCSGCKKYYKDATATQEIKQADTVTAKLPGGTVKPGADKSPQTGDNSNLLLWIALLFVSGGAAIGTTVVSRKKKYSK